MDGNVIRKARRFSDTTNLNGCVWLLASELMVIDISGVVTLFFKFSYYA